jgi:hypothetical protein
MKFKQTSLFFRLCLLCAAFTSATIFAAERPLWVRSFGVDMGIAGLYCQSDGDYLELPLRAFTPSNPTKIQIDGDNLLLYTKTVDPETGLPIYQESGRVNVPEASRQMTIAVRPADPVEGVPQFHIVGFDDDMPNFGANTIRVINYSPYNVAALFGDKRVLSKPGTSVIQEIEPDQKGRVFGIAGRLKSTEEGLDLETFYRGPISIPPGRRVTMLISYSVEALRARGDLIMYDRNGNARAEFVVAQWMDRAPRIKK